MPMRPDPRHMDMSAFDYALPDEFIARYPLEDRSCSAMLVYKDGEIRKQVFAEIGSFLPSGCHVVMNETKVLNARLEFKSSSGARIELFCLEPSAGLLPQEALQSESKVDWLVMVGNRKRWKDETLSMDLPAVLGGGKLVAERLSDTGREAQVRFSWDVSGVRFANILQHLGELPLPPYLKRDAETGDEERYNTVYARVQGSVAAPTAGLHFTSGVLDELVSNGCSLHQVRLHVGAGTFLPVTSATLEGHEMHSERIDVDVSTIRSLATVAGQEKILAVGTTSMRTLESLYWYGIRLMRNQSLPGDLLVDQWDPYADSDEALPPAAEVLLSLADALEQKGLGSLCGKTKLLIAPGYRFQLVDILLTNFHQPGSTLLLLVSAFIGEDWKRCYAYAKENQFRFLSFGDASLLFKR